MNDFNPLAPLSAQPHPDKRLKYSLGLVLGADALAQEQFYFLERDRLHARRLHGYGTVCGLRVSVDGPEVTVTTGLAVDARGRLIRVTREYRGNVQNWWGRQTDSPPPARVHVVLCYRECESDTVPVAGTPCRTEEESQAPSRITESFQLLFTTTPPPQAEEAAIDRLGGLLHSIEIVEDDAEPMPGPELVDDASLGELLDAVVNGDSLPADPPWVRRETFEQRMARLLELWLTEYLPRLADPTACDADSDLERSRRCDSGVDGLLLASIDLGDEGMPGAPDTAERPLLYPTRLLQEYMLRRDQVVDDHGVLHGLQDDDHHQYLNREGSDAGRDNAMTGDLQMGGHKVVGLQAAEDDGEAVPYQQAVKDGDSAGGDLDGQYRDPQVHGLLGHPILPAGEAVLPDDHRPDSGVFLRYQQTPLDHWELQRLTLGLLDDVDNSTPANGHLLVYRDGAWQSAAPTGDVVHDPDDEGTGPWLRVQGLQKQPVADVTPVPDQVLTFQAGAWRPMDAPGGSPGEANGDVTGAYDNLRVVRLQRRSMVATAPASGDVLTFYASRWRPRAVRELPFATVTFLDWVRTRRANSLLFEIWFHLDAPDNNAEIVFPALDPDSGGFDSKVINPDEPELEFYLEDAGASDLHSLGRAGVRRVARNLYQFLVPLDTGLVKEWQSGSRESAALPVRVKFGLQRLDAVWAVRGRENVLATGSRKVLEWARNAGITFSGRNTDSVTKEETVTRFVRVPNSNTDRG